MNLENMKVSLFEINYNKNNFFIIIFFLDAPVYVYIYIYIYIKSLFAKTDAFFIMFLLCCCFLTKSKKQQLQFDWD